ncbi:hypothetical protein D6745_05555 [Candidatus Woesearchaeota archaeon]|nr:MAG: hypothetical protein D6745_05555 [Candidatus Woesearchaeota archaeon]
MSRNKSLVFDAGPLISLTSNNLLWILKKLKKHFKGEFYITSEVEQELVHRPLNSKRFKFEALQVMKEIKKGVIKVVDNERIKSLAKELIGLANHCFSAHNNYIQVVHMGEMEVVATGILMNASALVIDERTMRYLIENPIKVKRRLQRKLHTYVHVDKTALKKLQRRLRGLKVIRSVELISVAYEMGLLNEYIPDLIESKSILLDAVLWGVKIDGCAVSEKEIDEIEKLIK